MKITPEMAPTPLVEMVEMVEITSELASPLLVEMVEMVKMVENHFRDGP